MRDENIQNCDQ